MTNTKMKTYENVYLDGDYLKTNASIYLNEQCDEYQTMLLQLVQFKDLSLHYEKAQEEENEVLEQMKDVISLWQEKAYNKKAVEKAMQYISYKPQNNTGNKWLKGYYGDFEISNFTYFMWVKIEERKSYRYDDNNKYYYVTWNFGFNTPKTNYYCYKKSLDGQNDKKFDDKEQAQKYISGRIKKYSNYFKKSFPPVPKAYKDLFMVGGILLPNYIVSEEEIK